MSRLGPHATQVISAFLPQANAALSEQTLRHAKTLGVFACVYPLVETSGVADRSQHQQWRREQRARITLLRHVQDHLLSALSEVPCVVLKGSPLSKLLFDDPFLRSTSDIDLLVHPRDVARALTCLSAAGCRRLDNKPLKPWAYNQVALAFGPLNVLVELHWALALPSLPSPEVDVLLAHAQPAKHEHPSTLSIEHTFFSLVYHFQQHHGAPKTTVDLAAWLDRFGETADWEAIAGLAHDLGIEGLIAWALGCIERLTRTQAPGPRWRHNTASRLWSVASERLCRGILARAAIPDIALLMVGSDEFSDKLLNVVVQTLALWPLDRAMVRVARSVQWLLLGPHRHGTWLAQALMRQGVALPGTRDLRALVD